MTTVFVSQPKPTDVNLFELMEAWISPDAAVYPVRRRLPPEDDPGVQRGRGRGRDGVLPGPAVAAALTELGYRRRRGDQGVPRSWRARRPTGKLESGDVFSAVDGKPIDHAPTGARRGRGHAGGRGRRVPGRAQGRRAQTVTVTPAVAGRRAHGSASSTLPTLPVPVRRRRSASTRHRRPERRADVLARHLRHADARVADRRRDRRRHRRPSTPTGRSARSAASSRRSPAPGRPAPSCSWSRRTTATRPWAPRTATCSLVRADTMHDAVDAIEAWVDDPDADLPQLREGGGVVTRPRARPRPCPRRRRPRDREPHRRGGLGPAGPAVRAGRHRPARGARASPRRGDGPRLVRGTGIADARSSRTSWRPTARSRRCWSRSPGPRASPAVPPSSSAWCCRRRPTTEIPDDPAGAEEFAREHPDRQEVRIVAGATRCGCDVLCPAAARPRRRPVGRRRQRPGARRCCSCWPPRWRTTSERTVRRGPARRKKARAAAPPRRSRALIITAAVLVVGFFSLTTFAVLLHRPACGTTPIGYSERLQHAVLDPGRAVPRVRRGDGAGRRRQHVPRLPVAPDVPAELAGADRPRPLPRRRHPDPHLAAGRRLGRCSGSSPAPRPPASGASTCCGATAATSAPRTPTSSATSASTSSTCRGCTTSSTPRWRSSWSRC